MPAPKLKGKSDESSAITIPGDERSHINPGRGYSEHTEEIMHYHSFATEEELFNLGYKSR